MKRLLITLNWHTSMFECMILGDSIATGIAQNRPECITYATVGVPMAHRLRINLQKVLYIKDYLVYNEFIRTKRCYELHSYYQHW
jgi:hypothetical protein